MTLGKDINTFLCNFLDLNPYPKSCGLQAWHNPLQDTTNCLMFFSDNRIAEVI